MCPHLPLLVSSGFRTSWWHLVVIFVIKGGHGAVKSENYSPSSAGGEQNLWCRKLVRSFTAGSIPPTAEYKSFFLLPWTALQLQQETASLAMAPSLSSVLAELAWW